MRQVDSPEVYVVAYDVARHRIQNRRCGKRSQIRERAGLYLPEISYVTSDVTPSACWPFTTIGGAIRCACGELILK
jgi:hypothetical protein